MKVFIIFLVFISLFATSVHTLTIREEGEYSSRISRQWNNILRYIEQKQKEDERLQVQIEAQIGQAKELGVKERVEGVIEGVIETVTTAEIPI